MSKVQQALDKITSSDKDHRYMATSDLLNELSQDCFRLSDAELERRISGAIITQLDDSSGDISGLAVKCLGVLVRRVSEPRALDVIGALLAKVTTYKKNQPRDIHNIGLKTVVLELPVTYGPSAAAAATERLLAAISAKENNEVVGDCLDLLTDVLARFGAALGMQHAAVVAVILPNLDEPRAALRKRALHCLGALSSYLNNEQLNAVMQHVVARLQDPSSKGDAAQTYIQAAGQIAKSVGYRFGPYLPTVVPLTVQHCKGATENDDELQEQCLQALEVFVTRCPHDTKQFMEPIVSTAITLLKHDPNYADDMEADEEEPGSEEEDDEDDDEDYSDDDDMSWKVRRAAAKLLSALVASYPGHIAQLYKAAAADLVGRLREREENVKVDVFVAYCDMVHQIGAAASRFAPDDPSNPLLLLKADASTVIRAAARQLSERKMSVKTKVGVFSVLQALVGVLPRAVADELQLLVPGILAALKDKTSSGSALKLEALVTLHQVLAANDPALFAGPLKELSAAVFAAAKERYYKVSAEALRVCGVAVSVLRPTPAAAPQPADLVGPLFKTLSDRLAAQDQDQEVKEAAIMGMAKLLAVLGDVIGSEVPATLQVLLERLRNEVTRLPALRGFHIIASSPLGLPLGAVLEPVLVELTSFLRKAHRPLRQASLETLEAIAAKHGSQLPSEPLAATVAEASNLISDSDLSLTSLTLELLVTLLRQQPQAVGPATASKALPAALALVKSPLLQGGASRGLQAFFPALAAAGVAEAGAEQLVDVLLKEGLSSAAGHHAQHTIAQCLAVLCTVGGGSGAKGLVERLLAMTSSKDLGSQRLGLLCLGELGRRTDLSSQPQAAAAIQAALNAPAEDIKAAASIALGGLTCGHLGKYLPELMQQVAGASSSKQQYLLLQALNEVVVTISSSGAEGGALALAPDQLQQLLQLLLGIQNAEEESRNVLAECLGRLALLYPAPVLAAMQQQQGAAAADKRSVAVAAVKHMMTDKASPVDAALKDTLLGFLQLMGDPDRHVRKAAVIALTAVAHHKPQLVGGHLPALLPLLYDQTQKKEELVRIVDLGPFKHQIDDGLELRKAAFEALDILLLSCPEALDKTQLLGALQSGIGDHVDVRPAAQAMVMRLCLSCPEQVLAAMEGLVDPLDKALKVKLKGDTVKQEKDRHEDMLQACMRVVDALHQVPGSANSAALANLMKEVGSKPELQAKYLAAQKERLAAAAAAGSGAEA